jgi:ribonuclease P/MRP protein subunit POP1
MANEEEYFDSLLGGTEELPSALTLVKFTSFRSQEIQIMKNSLVCQSGTKLAFQTLPKHMRRRAMSHNVKRLPRRLRQIHLNQMKKSGMPAKQKRPSRKYRRRPKNLTEEYTKRSTKRFKWLQTHIWHAKRFHMMEKWGYKLPYSPCDKAFRACYRAISQHCLLQDISYVKCIEISGDKNVIIENVKRRSKSDSGLTITAKAFLQGNREGELTLYDTEEESLIQRVIGLVNYQWQPGGSDNGISKLWLWVHASYYELAKNLLCKCFNNYQDIAVEELSDELSRFRLTGPLSNAVLHDALVTLNIDNNSTQQWFKEYLELGDNNQIINNQSLYWQEINNIDSVSELSPHIIHSLIVKDPRLNVPRKRTKSIPTFKKSVECNLIGNISASPLWKQKFRKAVNENKITDSQIADLQSKLLVPGSEIEQSETLIPIILIQKPGNKKENIGRF